MKIMYSIGLFLSVILLPVAFYFGEKVSFLRGRMYTEALSPVTPMVTRQAALISLGFIAFFALLYGLTLLHVRRPTAKVLSIIGISISGLVFFLSFFPLQRPSHISYDEFAPVHLIYAVCMTGLCIANFIQTLRIRDRRTNDQTIDDIT